MCVAALHHLLSQPSVYRKDVDDHQLSQVSMITKGLVSSTEISETNESALVLNISFTDDSSGRLYCSTGDIELAYRKKIGSPKEIQLDRVCYLYAHS